MIENSIVTTKIKKTFGEKTVLNDISINIEKGKIFGLLGPSGAGKTTFIKIITGQIKATSGTAEVLGTDVTKFDKKMYSNFGMMLDNTGVYKRMTCYENMVLFADIFKIPRQNINAILEKVGLIEAKKTVAERLSKGMQQRLVLARALLHEPQILFLDEPTSGLDPNTAKAIHRIIMEQKKAGTTVFLTTHNMHEAYSLCDQVALLNEGNIAESGSPEEICNRYNHQNGIVVETKDGQKKTFPNSPEAAKDIAELLTANAVLSIHSTEPTLETVFLELTGRKLDNDEL